MTNKGPSQPHRDEVEALTRPGYLRNAMVARQRALAAQLGVTSAFTAHPTTVGDAAEVNWTRMIRNYLPNRYGVGPILAIDADDRQSHQIDIGVYDQHYAPLWFETEGGVQIVPVESVYAVFEVKPEINRNYADYTGGKIASVRALRRTNGAFRHLGGTDTHPDLELKPILGGILSVRSGWTDMEGKAAAAALTNLDPLRRLDLGIALDALSFDISRAGEIDYSDPDLQLIFFAMRLFHRLQLIGTALAVDIREYERRIRES